MDSQKHLFAIGSIAKINGGDWKVVKYHRIGKNWEVMFQNLVTGEHCSIPTFILDTHCT